MFSDPHFRPNPMAADIKPFSAATSAVPINATTTTTTTNSDVIKPTTFRSVTSHTNGQVGPLLLKHNNYPLTAAVGYKECLKNHAASLGSHALDGCGEFFLDPTSNPADPTSLKCAACGCHRNFHRRSDALNSSPRAFVTTPTRLLLSPPQIISSPSRSTSPTATLSPHSPPQVSHVPPRSSFFNGAQIVLVNSGPLDEKTTKVVSSDRTARKRSSRTKFSGAQKEKMLGFAEKIGWRMERSKEVLVGEFCDQLGIGRNVFKVWMHNNKSRIINNNEINKQRFKENNNNNEINVNDDDGHHQRFYLSNNGGSNSSSS